MTESVRTKNVVHTIAIGRRPGVSNVRGVCPGFESRIERTHSGRLVKTKLFRLTITARQRNMTVSIHSKTLRVVRANDPIDRVRRPDKVRRTVCAGVTEQKPT